MRLILFVLPGHQNIKSDQVVMTLHCANENTLSLAVAALFRYHIMKLLTFLPQFCAKLPVIMKFVQNYQ